MPVILSAGLTHSLAQDTIYALPPKKVMLYSDVALELANTTTTTSFIRYTTTTTGLETAAAFVRCTSAATLCSVKAT